MYDDSDDDGRYDSGDFLALYAEGAADYDRSGVQNSDDFAAFLNDWIDAAR
ncbi:MAG: hypothetical protein RBS39_07955 [Phycisphaerales bacterium]|nr:hypothetical protein [Phycisphaerales bacterium]